jgi:hypothetical protein
LTAAYLIYPSSARGALIRPAAGLGLVGVLLMLPGLVAFQVGQSGRARVPGWIGTGLLVIGIASLEIPHLVMGLFDPSLLYNLDWYHSSIFGAMELYGVVALALGMIVLSVAIWRAGFYPRVTFWLMVANLVVSAAGSSVPAVADAVRQPAPSYLLVALIGFAMRRSAERPQTALPSRVDSATSPAV